MKRFNRILAALLAALMLCGACTTVAEMNVELNLDAQANPGSIELEIDPENGANGPDGGLALDDGLQLDGVDLLNPELEIGIEDNLLIDGAEAQAEELVHSNDSDSDFLIDEDGVLIEYWGDGGDVVIPDGVTRIGDSVFDYHNNWSITSITMPDSVTSIGFGAFQDCYNMKKIKLSRHLETIEHSAFNQCHGLKEISIPASLRKIEDYAFGFCIGLEKVKISSKDIKICKDSFHVDAEGYWSTGWDYYEDYVPPTFYIICSSNAITWARKAKYNVVTFGHPSKITDPEILPTTTEPGRTEGTHCSVCGEPIKKQKIIPVISLSHKQLLLNIGESRIIEILNLFDRKATWTSSDNKIATVKNGKVTAKKAGRCIVTVKIHNAGELSCKLTIKDAAAISDKTLSMQMGDTHKLTITGLAKRKVSWTSSNTAVATVKDGKVTAIKAGKCTIKAQIKNGKILTCKLTVTDPAALSAEKLTISTIDYARIKLTGALKRKVTWSTSDANVVKITKSDSSAASIKAVKTGTATITAKIEGGKTLKCAVTVVNPLSIKEDWDDDFDDLASWEVGVKFTNHSNKKIIYVTFDILQYNNRGDKLKSPYDYYYFNNDLNPHSSYWDNYTVNDDTRSVKFKITEVTFADKTTWKP